MRTIHDPAYIRLIEILKTRRKVLGWSQQEVAKRLGVHRLYVLRVEKRDRRIDLLEAMRICALYGLSVGELERKLSSPEKHAS